MIPPFHRIQFPLSEVRATLFVAPSFAPGDVWFEGNGKTEIYRIKAVRLRDSGLSIGHTDFLFDFQQTPKKLLAVLDGPRAKDLEQWLKLVGVAVTRDCKTYTPCPTKWMNPVGRKNYTPAGVIDEEDPLDEAPPAKAECPECYGTGFHKGFGAPCSKGCKVK